MDKESMGSALTQYAVAVSPTPFRHIIEVTTITRGGDIHLNGKGVVRIHPILIEREIPISSIISRVFEIIEEKHQVVIRLRRKNIRDAKKTVTRNLEYLMRTLPYEEFQSYIEGVIELDG